MIIPELLVCLVYVGYNKRNRSNDAAQFVVESITGEDERDKMYEGPSFISCRVVVCNTFLVSLLY